MPGALLLPARRRRRRARRRACRPRGRRPGGRRRPAGLSTTSEVLVLVRERRSARALARGRSLRRARTRQLLAALEPLALRRGAAVDEHACARRQPLGRRARADVARRGSGRAARPRRQRGRGCETIGESAAAREEQRDADDDERVREVERGPAAEVEEVGHVPEPDAVDEVREAAADHEAERRPASPGAARPERAKKTSIHATPIAVRTITTRRRAREEPERDPGVLDVVDRERPDDVDARRGRARSRRCASSAGRRRAQPRRRPRGRPTGGPGRERALGDRDRRQRVRRRADADVERRPRARLGHRAYRAVDAELGVTRAAPRACSGAIGFGRSARTCRTCRRRCFCERRVRSASSTAARCPRGPVVELAVERDRGDVRRGGCRSYVSSPRLVLDGPGVLLRAGTRSRARRARAPSEQRSTHAAGVDRAHARPFSRPRRASLRFRPGRSRRAPRSCHGGRARRRARHAALRHAERLGRAGADDGARSPGPPSRRRRDAHLPRVAVAADDARPAAPGEAAGDVTREYGAGLDSTGRPR